MLGGGDERDWDDEAATERDALLEQYEEFERLHRAEAHGGGPCDCIVPEEPW